MTMISGRRNSQATEMNPGTSPRTLDVWKGAVMPTRKAHARWEGSLKEGKGQVDFGNGAFKAAYSFASRFEDGAGTNPEELLGAGRGPGGLLRDGAVADIGQRGLQARLCGRDRARHRLAARRRLQNHQEPTR